MRDTDKMTYADLAAWRRQLEKDVAEIQARASSVLDKSVGPRPKVLDLFGDDASVLSACVAMDE